MTMAETMAELWPLPWRLVDAPADARAEWCEVLDATDTYVPILIDLQHGVDDDRIAMVKEVLIAVNAFDALVAALEAVDRWAHAMTRGADLPMWDRETEAIVHAALRLARGEEES